MNKIDTILEECECLLVLYAEEGCDYDVKEDRIVINFSNVDLEKHGFNNTTNRIFFPFSFEIEIYVDLLTTLQLNEHDIFDKILKITLDLWEFDSFVQERIIKSTQYELSENVSVNDYFLTELVNLLISKIVEEYCLLFRKTRKEDTKKNDPNDSIEKKENTAESHKIINKGHSTTVFKPYVKVYSSDEIIERKSVFQAHVANVRTIEEIECVLKSLETNPRFKRATHNIVAYVISASDANHVKKNYDSDGEHGAGSGLHWLLSKLKIKDVVVIVSRWYGGVKLGPQRFKIINSCAHKALIEANLIN